MKVVLESADHLLVFAKLIFTEIKIQDNVFLGIFVNVVPNVSHNEFGFSLYNSAMQPHLSFWAKMLYRQWNTNMSICYNNE